MLCSPCTHCEHHLGLTSGTTLIEPLQQDNAERDILARIAAERDILARIAAKLALADGCYSCPAMKTTCPKEDRGCTGCRWRNDADDCCDFPGGECPHKGKHCVKNLLAHVSAKAEAQLRKQQKARVAA